VVCGCAIEPKNCVATTLLVPAMKFSLDFKKYTQRLLVYKLRQYKFILAVYVEEFLVP
jgi:hypothetical protein